VEESALDAVNCMNVGGLQAEHLDHLKRSHFDVVTDAGDQPKLFLPKASICAYFQRCEV